MTTIRKADGLAFQANMEYILNIIGTKVDDRKYEVETKGGLLSIYIYPWEKGEKVYSIFGRFNQIPPSGTIPSWLYNAYNGKCNWIILECDDAFRGWMRPFEEVMKGLCLMIHGHDNFPNAIAKRGRLEDFIIPEKGHLVHGKEKLTVAAFRKKYATTLGIEGCLMMDGSFLPDDVPFSPFGKDAFICIFPR